MAGTLYTKLRTTNAIENLNGGITTYSRHVKRWRSGTMVVRWVSAAIVDGCFRHQLLLPRPYLVLTKPLRLDIQCQRAASVKIGWKYLLEVSG